MSVFVCVFEILNAYSIDFETFNLLDVVTLIMSHTTMTVTVIFFFCRRYLTKIFNEY